MLKLRKKNKGIALLMAMYISSAASLLGLGVFMLLYGQLGIAGTAKGSVVAFYAADTGLECALYGDLVSKIFSTSTPPATINCAGSDRNVAFQPSGMSGTFKFDYQVSPNACVSVTVQKLASGQTILDSFGENVSDCSVSSTRSIQRGLEVTY
ncbi:MAG: hypothetical protein UW30_C0017G0011 [Candidatus Giovannonibacteria bacterium GW2011_GWA2_44_13b]|uniref:Type 4 fimbrial biogenesis protein PilX N-terminal domain-containing protein n=2 Tax=Candidatus Giovannoniibacteriota TaxID=1752738 RepID=A0A0G1H0B5_9BACT|nr:MAG: hypothetical protein UW30_C0017G0011 [Candidatus Giovannonibacteria bacterium GW2011_GWA2_44_13b]OGF82025.1 MAG: hypothetical protein A2924_00275 [Candidatus Giovannonibacteria bacterium RIFCSPLOWO2_01_FULL_44_16]